MGKILFSGCLNNGFPVGTGGVATVFPDVAYPPECLEVFPVRWVGGVGGIGCLSEVWCGRVGRGDRKRTALKNLLFMPIHRVEGFRQDPYVLAHQ